MSKAAANLLSDFMQSQLVDHGGAGYGLNPAAAGEIYDFLDGKIRDQAQRDAYYLLFRFALERAGQRCRPCCRHSQAIIPAL